MKRYAPLPNLFTHRDIDDNLQNGGGERTRRGRIKLHIELKNFKGKMQKDKKKNIFIWIQGGKTEGEKFYHPSDLLALRKVAKKAKGGQFHQKAMGTLLCTNKKNTRKRTEKRKTSDQLINL
mmetsp:Transcript_3835/g.4197  ORF Transcript_3835/g.4197 Transcript_3835/m.4197 type:complete len:122 (-) Transcript_3835:214-579(-)